MDYHHIMEISSKTGGGGGVSNKKMDLQALAEVAIGRLMEEQDEAMNNSKTKIVCRNYSLKQIRKLSEKKLLMTFAERLKRVVDKNQKLFSYKCQILPHLCQQTFECYSTADEEALKESMVNHLLGHLCNLEKSEPLIKIASRRTVKSRNRAPSVSSTAKKTTTAPKRGTAAKGNSGPAAAAVATPVTMISSASAGGGGGTPLDMSASSMVLKFLESDHPYTMTTPSVSLPVSSSTMSQSSLASRSGILSEALSSAGILTESSYPSVITAAAVAASAVPSMPTNIISPMADIRSSPQQHQHQPSSPVTVPIDPSTAQNIRALALDYIDDIRKKSSSAAKSVIVNGDKSLVYQCKICPDKQFTSTNGLIFHYKKHAGLKPYVCELCSATFTRQHSLNYHMLIHLNKSRFVCSECGRHFRHPSHFKEHMRRHTGETPFQCSDCLIRFKTRNTYKRHLQTKHAKILTSKGIIELSSAGPTYQGSMPKAGTSPPESTGTTMTMMEDASSSGGGGAMKGRRKHAVRYYPKDAEMAKYEEHQQQQQQGMMPVIQGQPLDFSQHPAMHGPSSNAPANITILQIPQLAGVHLLDNTGTLSPTTRLPKLDQLPEHHHHYPGDHHPGHPITLVSYQSPALEPIQPTSASSFLHSPPINSGQLTELTSSPALSSMMTAGSVHHPPAGGHQPELLGHHSHHQSSQSSGNRQPSNDNFNMLLAAIEMTEEPKQEL